MLRRTFTGIAVGAVLAVPAVAFSAAPVAAAPAVAAAVTLTYDDSTAAEFKPQVTQAVGIWNTSVSNVRLVKATAGQRVNIRITADNDWPRANLGPVRPTGTVNVWIGRQAVTQGYNVVRIVAHELGHSLGLPDVKPGPCSSLMSGSTGGVSCNSLTPNASEAARVQQNYASALATAGVRPSGSGVVLRDAA
ncbi:snapalysin family zinc-dependent metalloprotease [Streptomyces sp. NPDC048290]|uniref:snapalysin family zinc-dependent metalloprotease n=1 Tax=Streptomyces sp. NPDC048290 TaxID=3155811 RepID=UPI0034218780